MTAFFFYKIVVLCLLLLHKNKWRHLRSLGFIVRPHQLLKLQAKQFHSFSQNKPNWRLFYPRQDIAKIQIPG